MRIIQILAVMAMALQLSGLGAPTALADETYELLNGANVVDAKATPAPKGGVSRITLRLENYSNTDVYLVGIRSPLAASGALMIQAPGEPAQIADQYLIRAEETLDLATTHIWLELRDMRAPLSTGEAVEFELVFRKGVATGVAHVHP